MFYLIDGKGEIIYHPRQKLIYTDLYQENNIEAAGYEDGSTEEIFQGEKRLVTVKTVSYTGWKIVSVVPMSSFDMGMTGHKIFCDHASDSIYACGDPFKSACVCKYCHAAEKIK